MRETIQSASDLQSLSQTEWESLRELIHRVTGIALSPAKKSLLVARLSRRLRANRLASFAEYYDKIVNGDIAGEELQELVNAITTNKTAFFREPHHFDLLEKWLQSPDPRIRNARQRGLRVWCAAASTGEEVYTIAAVVRSALSQSEWQRATVFGTDLDTKALQVASQGSYEASDIESVSEFWRGRLFARAAGADSYVVRPELRERVRLGQLNLAKAGWGLPRPLDAVFCRNVLIYFDQQTQLAVVRRACALLAPHGLLFLGHSEGLVALELQLESVGHTAYRLRTGSRGVTPKSLPQVRAVALSDAVPSRPRPYVMGAQGNVRLRPKNGLLVLLFDAQAAQSCMAYLKDDTSTAAGELHARQVLDAMVCAMRRPGTRDEAIQAKTVGTVDLMATSKGHTADLHSFVNTWLQGAGIPLAATREVPVDTEMRIDLGTGRIRLASSSQPGIGAGVGSLRTSGPESGAGESR